MMKKLLKKTILLCALAGTIAGGACNNVDKIEYEGTAHFIIPIKAGTTMPRGMHDAEFGLIRGKNNNYFFYLKLIQGSKKIVLTSTKAYRASELVAKRGKPFKAMKIPMTLPGKTSTPLFVVKLLNKDKIRDPSALKGAQVEIPEEIGLRIFSVERRDNRFYVGKMIGRFYGSFSKAIKFENNG